MLSPHNKCRANLTSERWDLQWTPLQLVKKCWSNTQIINRVKYERRCQRKRLLEVQPRKMREWKTWKLYLCTLLWLVLSKLSGTDYAVVARSCGLLLVGLPEYRRLPQTRLIMFYKCLEVRIYRTLTFWLTSEISICPRLKSKYYRVDLKHARVSGKFPAPWSSQALLCVQHVI